MANDTELVVVNDLMRFRRQVDGVVKKQIPFATARALTLTARDVRDVLRDELPEHFTVRSARNAKGIQSRSATKKRLVSRVGSKDDYMELQAEGGVKTPGPGSQHVAVPHAARRRPTSKTTKARWPGALEKKGRGMKKPFWMTTRSGKLLLAKRRGKKRLPVKVLYALETSVKVPKRWPFKKTVERVVRARWPVNMRRAMREALKSAKK